MCPSFKDWGGSWMWFLDCHPDSSFSRWPQLWHSASVFSSLHPFPYAHCTKSYPLVHLFLTSQVLAPAWRRSESPDRALHIRVSHDHTESAKSLSFLSSYTSSFFEFGVEVAFYNEITTGCHTNTASAPLSACHEALVKTMPIQTNLSLSPSLVVPLCIAAFFSPLSLIELSLLPKKWSSGLAGSSICLLSFPAPILPF